MKVVTMEQLTLGFSFMRAEADRLIREHNMQTMDLAEVDELLDKIFIEWCVAFFLVPQP